MTDLVEPKCIAPNCQQPAAVESALCSYHKELLKKVEGEILLSATRNIKAEMRQFERLMYLEDDVNQDGKLEYQQPLTVEEIAHRMVWPVKKVRQMLRKFKDDRA